jgi:hypothetical protein
MNTVAKLWLVFILVVVLPTAFFLYKPHNIEARNVHEYSDTIEDSAPRASSNHTFRFKLETNVSPGGRLEFTMPSGFEIATSTEFGIRNVELLVEGVPRTADVVASPGVDQVEITYGSPGFIRYTLAPDFSIAAGSHIEFRIGNNTSNSIKASTVYSTSTMSTTTILADVSTVHNSATIGTHEVKFEVWDNGLTAEAGFLIAMVNRVYNGKVNTREKVPPFRFNAAPTSTVGGTTLSVEISLETDEFAICKYSKTPGVGYPFMTSNFSNTGLIFHSTVVPVTANSVQKFYVRCIDDEGNFNIDDYLIMFTVNNVPTGTANITGSTSGDGTGSGNTGGGNGSGGGGTSGGSNGQTPTTGGTAGSGGYGGGGGGGTGGSTGNSGGGGFEAVQDAYRSGDARVVISGFAFPNSPVAVLVDGKVAQTTRSGSNGAYTVTLDAIARGVYTFGVYAEGPDKVRSSTFSTSFTVTGGRTSELTNINVSPSIKVSPDPVNPGQTLTATGYGLPNATISIQNGKQKSGTMSEFAATADGNGKWTTTIPTDGLVKGAYQIRAKSSVTNGAVTGFSAYTYYTVGEKAGGALNADLSRDGKVNLTDFSILLYWWGGTGGNSDPPADINHDGKVNLTDFSILLFNWSG